MKAVLLSIKPKYCELIASGKKTIEVRKTKPKLQPPFKCLIYCTKPKYEHEDYISFNEGTEQARAFYGGGRIIGEFVCDRIEIFDVPYPVYSYEMRKDIQDLSGLGYFQRHKYANHKYRSLYAWYISNLVIYDKLKELSEFHRCCSGDGRVDCEYIGVCDDCCYKQLKRPPQSWCYVEKIIYPN